MRCFRFALCKHTHSARLEASIISSAHFISQLWKWVQSTFYSQKTAVVKELLAQNISKSVCPGFRCIQTMCTVIDTDEYYYVLLDSATCKPQLIPRKRTGRKTKRRSRKEGRKEGRTKETKEER
jgi:hypothetical protein